MIFRPLLGLLVKSLDVLLQLAPIDPPHASAPDLDRRKLAGAHERVDLGDADAQIGGHVVQCEEARLDLGHRQTIAADRAGYLNLRAFALVWWALLGGGSLWL